MVSDPIAALCVIVILSGIFATSVVVVVLNTDLSIVMSFVFLLDFNVPLAFVFLSENFAKESNYPKKNGYANAAKDPFLIVNDPVNNMVNHFFTYSILNTCKHNGTAKYVHKDLFNQINYTALLEYYQPEFDIYRYSRRQ